MARKSFIKTLAENIRLRFMIDTEKGVVKTFWCIWRSIKENGEHA